MNGHVVSEALKYYDQNNEKYKRLTDKIKYWQAIEREHDTDTSPRVFIFMNGDRKELFRSRVEVLGRYNKFVWEWGWTLADMANSYLKTIRSVLLYGTDIDTHTNRKNIFLKSELTTSHFKITDIAQIEIHCAIAMYLTKKKLVLPVLYKGDVSVCSSELPTMDTFYMFVMDPPDAI